MALPRFEILLKDGAEKWRVIIGNPGTKDGKESAARMYPETKRIVLRAGRAAHLYERDLLHEILHAESELDEDAVLRIERSQNNGIKELRKFLSENPQK